MNQFVTDFQKRLDMSPLTSEEKHIVEMRYISLLTTQQMSYDLNWALFMIGASVSMISGILVTAILSLQHFAGLSNESALRLFWVTWALSLAVNFCHGYMAIFDVHKKYCLGNATLEKLKSEGTLFMAGVGIYAMNHGGMFTSIDWPQRYFKFVGRVELIHQLSVENSPGMSNTPGVDKILAAGPNGDDQSSAKSSSKASSRSAPKSALETASKSALETASKSTPRTTPNPRLHLHLLSNRMKFDHFLAHVD